MPHGAAVTIRRMNVPVPGCRMALNLFMALAMALIHADATAADGNRMGLQPCRLAGVEHGALCGRLSRPLDPAAPGQRQIDVHFAVLPALSRNRLPDPVFFFAGGPGQSAIELAPTISRLVSRLGYRRDVVLVDQRGTGQSAPLSCESLSPTTPLAQAIEPQLQQQHFAVCLQQLKQLPYGDLRHFTTWVAMQDVDAVRRQLGAEKVNLVGGSYGTRAVLDYMRQFPDAVRRAVMDGVAPPDMVLPATAAVDSQAALELALRACEDDGACARRWPALRQDWLALLSSLPRQMLVQHPVTGVPESLLVTRDLVLQLVRGPLYVPALAAGLPAAMQALSEPGAGRLEPLMGLANAMVGGGKQRSGQLYEGMHLSVICSEDLPRLAMARDAPGVDVHSGFAEHYRAACANWPKGEVPLAFYNLPAAKVAVLLLSGGADPATPPRHAERVARAMGKLVRHVVVTHAGHGVLALPCMRDVLQRFIDAATDEEALSVSTACLAKVPRPDPFLPLQSVSGVAQTGSAAIRPAARHDGAVPAGRSP